MSVSRRARAATWAHVVTLLASAGLLAFVNRDNWFLHDEWAFVVDRAFLSGDGNNGIWVPHNEHLSMLPNVIYQGLVTLFGIDSYWPFIGVLIGVHLLLAHLLWRIIRRVAVDPWIATAGATIVLFMGTGAENLTRAFQMTLLGSLAAGLAWLLVMPSSRSFDPKRDIAGWGLGLIALMSSGVGIVAVGAAALYALMSRGWRMALVVMSVPSVAYALWWGLYGRRFLGFGGQPLGDGIRDVPAYVWTGISGSLDDLLGFTAAGLVVLLAVGIWAILRARALDRPLALALSCAAGATAQLTLTALRRSHLGIEGAENSRYAYITIVLVLPLLCLAIDRALPAKLHLVVLAVGTALVLVVQVPKLADFGDTWSAVAQEERRVMLASVELSRSGERLLGDTPYPSYAPDAQVQDLVDLVDQGSLTPDAAIDQEALLTARTFLQLSAEELDRSAPPVTGDARVEAFAGVEPAAAPAPPGCTTWAPTSSVPVVRLGLDGPTTLTVTTEAGGSISAAFTSSDARVGSLMALTLEANAGAPLAIESSAAIPVDLQLALPAQGDTTICGLQQVR